MSIEAGIFDIGNVVVRSDESLLAKDIKKELKIDNKKLWELMKIVLSDVQTGKIDELEFLKNIGNDLGEDINVPIDLLERSYREGSEVIEETRSIIKNLKKQDIQTAALSNTIPSQVRINRAKGIYDLFDIDVLSCEVGMRKPDPKIFKLSLERLRVKPDEAFFTDDRTKFVDAAKVVGLEVILFENPDQLRSELGEMGLII